MRGKGRWGNKAGGARRPGIQTQIKDNVLIFGQVQMLNRDQVVDNVDIAIHRLLDGEGIFLQELKSLTNAVQRTIDQVLHQHATPQVTGD